MSSVSGSVAVSFFPEALCPLPSKQFAKILNCADCAKRKPKIFGAETHRFTLNPIVRNSEVSKFEVKQKTVSELPVGLVLKS